MSWHKIQGKWKEEIEALNVSSAFSSLGRQWMMSKIDKSRNGNKNELLRNMNVERIERK